MRSLLGSVESVVLPVPDRPKKIAVFSPFRSFHNLIREDEQQQIEASIWEQIDSGNENDYIHFHLRKADGSYLSVLDHGRIVESPQYGKVFYVLFMDWEDMHIHYSDKFSG